MNEIKIFTDGGAINNPGKAAIGVVIIYNGNLKEYAKEIGIKTNNEAEYEGVIFALRKIKQLLGKDRIKELKITLHLDSELVGKQIKGEIKILDEKLQKYFLEVYNLKFDFPKLEIKIIPREENKRADSLVKSILFKKPKNIF